MTAEAETGEPVPALSESWRGASEVFGYQLAWLLVLPLAIIPPAVAGGVWFEAVGEPVFVAVDMPGWMPAASTAHAAVPFLFALMVVTTAAAGAFAAAGLPRWRESGPRFSAWLPAACVLLVTSAATALGILFRVVVPPGPEAVGVASRTAELAATWRPILAAGCYASIAVIALYLLIGTRRLTESGPGEA